MIGTVDIGTPLKEGGKALKKTIDALTKLLWTFSRCFTGSAGEQIMV